MALTVEQAELAKTSKLPIRAAVTKGATTELFTGYIMGVWPEKKWAGVIEEEKDGKEGKVLGWVSLENISLLEAGG